MGNTAGLTMGIDEAVLLDAPVVRVFGAVASGKTELLVRKAAELARSGVDPSRILVAVGTDAAARVFRRRLDAAGAPCPGPEIATPLRVFMQVLTATPAPASADAPCSAAPRLLTRAEFNIVIEDLKHAGAPTRTIGGMLGAAARGLAAGEPPERWDMDDRQREACAKLRGILKALGAATREELPCRLLHRPDAKGDEGGGGGAPFSHVLVDDAQNLGPATLGALARLASIQVVLAGNPAEALPGFDPGFTPGAFETLGAFAAFSGLHEIADVTLAGQGAPGARAFVAAADLANALCDAGRDGWSPEKPAADGAPASPSVTAIEWREPSDEFKGVARIVADLLSRDSGLLPRDVFVGVPNRTWALAIERELGRRRIDSQVVLDDDAVSGDPRSPERLGTLEAYGALALAARPSDPAAWRFWLALGRGDLACEEWASLQEYANGRGASVRDAVEEIAQSVGRGAADAPATVFEGAGHVAERFRAAEALLRSMEGKRGFALRNLLCRRFDDPRLRAAFEFFDGDEDAAALFEAMQALSFSPCFADRPSQVCIGSYRAALALTPRHVLLPGLVDDAGLSGDALGRALGCAAGKAASSLVVSRFRYVGADEAAALRLPVRRTRRYRGRNVVPFSRAPLLDEAGETLPGSVSGEQFFALDQVRASKAAHGRVEAVAKAEPPRAARRPQPAHELSRLASQDVVVRRQRCVRARNRHASCRRCVDACTSGCISLEDGEPVVDLDRCVGCGTCCTACPTCALEAANPNDASLFARAEAAMRAAGGTAVLASERALDAYGGAAHGGLGGARAYDPAKVVPVANLGRVEETLIVRLVVAGATGVVLVQAPQDPSGPGKERDATGGEREAAGARTARLVCESANAVLAAWGSPVRARVVESLPPCVAPEEDPSHRPPAPSSAASPSSAGAATEARAPRAHVPADPADEIPMKVMKDGTLPHFTPDRRERLLDALFDMGEPADVAFRSRLWGHVSIDLDRCTGCRQCATFCPTGALFKYTDADGTSGVDHAPADCVQCLCCQDVCRARAVTVDDEVRAPDILAGTVERYAMPPEALSRTDSHSIYKAMKKALKIDRLFER